MAANGGTDLIYVPDGDAARIADVATFLLGQDYVDALFVDGPANAVPGALSLRDINLVGSARLPAPSIVVALKTFSRDPRDPIRSQVDVSDTTLQQGQGGHGSFGRADVTNTMIAFGPDFKRGFVDRSPASNADLPVTLAHILGLTLPSRGKLRGRVLAEAVAGGPPAVSATCGEAVSTPGQGRAPNGATFSDGGRRPLPRRRQEVQRADRLGRLVRCSAVHPAEARSEGHLEALTAELTARRPRSRPTQRLARRRRAAA